MVGYATFEVSRTLLGKSEYGRLKNIKFQPDTKIIKHQQVIDIMGISNNTPLYKLDLRNITERIQTIPEVESVSLKRKANNQLIVKIAEREPIALWQFNGQYYPIDKQGRLIDNPQSEAESGMYIFIGDQPSEIQEIIDIVKNNSILKENINALEWIEDRRWNILLKNGITIKLPEQGIKEAIDIINKKHKRNMLLEKDISIIDLRDLNRMIIK